MKHLMVGVLVALQAIPLPVWAALPPTTSPRTLGMVRMAPLSARWERGVRRWLENIGEGAVSISSISHSYPVEMAGNVGRRSELSQAVRELNQLLLSSELDSQERVDFLLENIFRLRTQAELLSDGALLQRSHLIEGATYWKRGDQERARRSILAALLLHPQYRAQLPTEWELGGLEFDSASFEAEVERARQRGRANCSVSLKIPTSQSRLFINGFPLERVSQIGLVTGARYRIDVVDSEGGRDSKTVDCGSQKRVELYFKPTQKMAVNLPRTEEVLSELGRINGVGSLILVDSVEERLKLFLYTPGKNLDEIPMTRSISLAEAEIPNEVPIKSDAFLTLLEKHQPGAGTLVSSGTSEAVSVSQSPWYNNWKVWTVIGVIGGAVVVALAANRGSDVKTQPVGISIKLP